MSTVILRPQKPGDIPAGLSLCRIAGWNQKEADWRLFQEFNPDGCFAAVHDDRVVGTVTTHREGDGIGWIALLVVHPEMRSRGAGKLLFRRALAALEDVPCVKLLATRDGIELYRAHDFRAEENYTLLVRPAGAVSDGGAAVRLKPIGEEDLSEVVSFDAETNGAFRERLLRGLWSLDPDHSALVRNGAGEVRGFFLSRPGENYRTVGPLAARDIDTAREMILCFLESGGGGTPAGVLVPDLPEWTTRLEDLGFVRTRSLVLMYRGVNVSFPGRGRFGVAGPDFGY